MVKKFSVGGMSCSACVQGIEKTLKKEKGINAVAVSLLEKTMTVDFDENIIPIKRIIALVENLGYSVFEYGLRKEDKFSDAILFSKISTIKLFAPYFLIALLNGVLN